MRFAKQIVRVIRVQIAICKDSYKTVRRNYARIGLMKNVVRPVSKARATVKTALLSLALALTLAACGAMPTPVVRPTGPAVTPSRTGRPRETRTPRPTHTPGPSETPTGFASMTPRPLPSRTPALPFVLLSSPSFTPTTGLPFPTITPTVRFVTVTPTKPQPIPLDCNLVWQSPASTATYEANDKFSTGWDVRNVGTATWDPGSVQFVYLGGARLATHDDVVPLQESVPPGQEVVLSVPMKAPATPNNYTTHWGLRQGTEYFCRLTLTIHVP